VALNPCLFIKKLNSLADRFFRSTDRCFEQVSQRENLGMPVGIDDAQIGSFEKIGAAWLSVATDVWYDDVFRLLLEAQPTNHLHKCLHELRHYHRVGLTARTPHYAFDWY
jgi:hypothetical protein